MAREEGTSEALSNLFFHLITMGYTLTIEVSLIHLVDVPNNYVGVIITKIL